MSSFMVIAAVSNLLRHTLWEAYQIDPIIQNMVAGEQAIVLTNPADTARDSTNRLSLWLYQVTENESVRNSPPAFRISSPPENQEPTTAFDLYYLITPFATSIEADQMLLERTIKAFHDKPVLNFIQSGDPVEEKIHIIRYPISLEELTRLWQALREPFRLSVVYRVSIVASSGH
jgi:hypothetical protein